MTQAVLDLSVAPPMFQVRIAEERKRDDSDAICTVLHRVPQRTGVTRSSRYSADRSHKASRPQHGPDAFTRHIGSPSARRLHRSSPSLALHNRYVSPIRLVTPDRQCVGTLPFIVRIAIDQRD